MRPEGCDRVRPLLVDYLYGELDQREAARIRAHIDSCQGCSRHLQELEQTRLAMASLPALTPPRAAVVSVIHAAERGVRADRRVWWPMAPALGAAVAALLLALVWGHMVEEPGPTEGPVSGHVDSRARAGEPGAVVGESAKAKAEEAPTDAPRAEALEKPGAGPSRWSPGGVGQARDVGGGSDARRVVASRRGRRVPKRSVGARRPEVASVGRPRLQALEAPLARPSASKVAVPPMPVPAAPETVAGSRGEELEAHGNASSDKPPRSSLSLVGADGRSLRPEEREAGPLPALAGRGLPSGGLAPMLAEEREGAALDDTSPRAEEEPGLVAQGVAAFRAGRYQVAVDKLTEARVKGGVGEEGLFHLAMALDRLGRFAAAVQVYEVLVARFPTGPRIQAAMRSLARDRERIGDRPGAVRAWRGYLDRWPGDREAADALQRLTDGPGQSGGR